VRTKLDNGMYSSIQSVTIKPVYKGHSWKPENVAFMSYCPLYTG